VKPRSSPRLSEEGAIVLQNHYVSLRTSIRKQDGSSVPITVRQLEGNTSSASFGLFFNMCMSLKVTNAFCPAIVRISESLAKMTLSPVANKSHVEEVT